MSKSNNQQNNQLVVIHDNLNKLIENNVEAMPKGFNKTRFIQNCMVVLRDTRDIDKVQPISVARTMLRGAFLGLDFFNKECYAIPYNENIGTKESPKWVKSLQFQTDYKGEVKLAKKYSVRPIKDIYAKLVREGDEFDEKIVGGEQSIDFKPIPFNNGNILGAFAVVLFQDGSMLYETMSTEEIEDVRKNFSKQAQGQAWTKSYGEMCRKTVLRRLCKNIELDFDTIEQAEAFEESADMDFTQESKPKQSSPLVVDAEYEVVEEETDEVDDLVKGFDEHVANS